MRAKTYTVVESCSGLESIEGDWSSLLATQPQAHLACSYAYLVANATQRFRDRQWRTYLVHSGDHLVGGLFGVRDRLSRRGLSLPFVEVGTEFASDPLCRPEDPQDVLGNLLVHVLETERDCAFLQFSRLTRPALERLSDVLARLRLRHSLHHAPFGYAWDTRTSSRPVLSRMGYKSRQLTRRTERKLARDFTVDMDRTDSTDPARNIEMLERFIELEAAGWKGRQGGSIRTRPGNAEYFRSIVEIGARSRLLRWYTLFADGRPCAMKMCMQTHNTLWMPKIAFDETLAGYRPGHELLRRVLEDCLADESVDRLDFISGPQWLEFWRPERQPHFALRIFNSTPLGLGAATLDRARQSLRGRVAREEMELVDRERRYL